MAIDIGGAKIEGSGRFRIKNGGGSTIFDRGFTDYNGSTFAQVQENNKPIFIAGPGTGVTLQWDNYATNAWAKVNHNCINAVVNVGSHYSTTNTRFTAPITGPYLFLYTGYDRSTNYWHPQFAVNASVSTRRTAIPYRIRQHGASSDYAYDSQMSEIIYLTAGDYVEVYFYAGGTGNRYSGHNLFAGMFVG